MNGCNRVVIMGHLTRDPEVRQVAGGKAVAGLGVAINDSYRNAKGETVEKPCFVDVVVWGATAEACGKYLKKGRPVLVDGRLQFDEWETPKGETRNRLKVRAESVQFLGNGDNGKRGSGGEAPVGAGRGTRTANDDAEPF